MKPAESFAPPCLCMQFMHDSRILAFPHFRSEIPIYGRDILTNYLNYHENKDNFCRRGISTPSCMPNI